MAQVFQITDDIYQFEPGPGNLSSAVFFIKGPQTAVIETGPSVMVPHIMEGIRQVGSRPEDVAYIIVTHVHMDHAGGMGTLARLLPQAKVVVHQEGVRHALDPSRLIAGTKMTFGDEFEKRFGAIEPVPQAQLVSVSGGESFALDGRQLQIVDAPGHAPHHLAVFDSKSRGLFAGESLGSFDPAVGVMIPASAPPAFDPDLSVKTMDHLETLGPEIIFFSHQGASRDIARLVALARLNTVEFGRILLAAFKEKASQEETSRRLETYLRSQGAAPGQKVAPPGNVWDIVLGGYQVYFKKKGML